MIKKILFALILFTGTFFIFNNVEFELLNRAMNKNFQSIIFSAVLAVSSFKPGLRMKMIYTALVFISAAAVIYLMNNLALSNSFASIGIGMLFLILFSYFPQLIKKGYIEKI